MDTQSIEASPIQPSSTEDFADPDGTRPFVEHYLSSRGFHVTTRNARVVVAALATCGPAELDWSALERHVDGALDREMLRPAA